jgi:mannitol 2-dehydrogenase
MTQSHSGQGTADLATPQGRLAAAALIPAPGYDRSRLTVGIAHLGTGAFHRAHQAMYLDRLLRDGETRDQALSWGICGIDVMPGDRPKHRQFHAQDCCYTLVVKQPDGTTEPRVIGSIRDYRYAPDEPGRVLDLLTSPRTRIVSLTITEGGYCVNQVTGEFDPSSPGIQADLRPGAVPGTAFGLITEALATRRADGVPPFTVMSCDNIQHNGDVAAAMLSAFATLRDPALGDWIRDKVAFPNSMVDRITPVTTAEDIERLRTEHGVRDQLAVVCEPFAQWVIQDRFPLGRPPWERCGAHFVADVTPFELMKLRLLNASHQAMAYAGYLAGYRYAHEVADDPVFAEFLLGYMREEGRPTLPSVPSTDLDEYMATLLRRFASPAIRDTLARLAAFSSDRIPKWVVPVIRENVAAGRQVDRAAAVVASWARYAEGVDEAGQPIEVVDSFADELAQRAGRQSADPLAFVRDERLFGDLASQPAFARAYREALESLHANGARATFERLNERLRRSGPDPAR